MAKKIPSFAIFNVFKKRETEKNIQERLKGVGITIQKNESETICLKCKRSIKILEDAHEIEISGCVREKDSGYVKRKQQSMSHLNDRNGIHRLV